MTRMNEKHKAYLLHVPRWAEVLTSQLYPPETYVLEPSMRRILAGARLNGKRVLDVGCGYGRFAEYMKDLGADVLGIDICQEMVARSSHSIECQWGDVQDIPFRNGTFDFILCSMVLMTPTVPNIQRAFREMWRVLRSSGTLVFAIVHPCFASWGINRNFPFERAQDYFAEGKRAWPLRLIDGTVLELEYLHRPLETYFAAMQGLFRVEALWEPKCSDPAANERYWKDWHYAEVEYLVAKGIKLG